MAARFMFGTYGIAGACIYGSNNTDYQIKSPIINAHWNFLKVNSTYGKTCATLFFTLSPALVPVYGISLPLMLFYEYSQNNLEKIN